MFPRLVDDVVEEGSELGPGQLHRRVGDRADQVLEVEVAGDGGGGAVQDLQGPRALLDRPARRPPHLRHLDVGVDPRQQLAPGEGLDQVVVGAGVQPLDLGLLPRAGGQHYDGRAGQRRVGPDRPQEAEAVEPGHHHVGQHQVWRGLPRRLQGGLAVAERGDDIALALQQPGDVAAHVSVVVGQQDPLALAGQESAVGGDGVQARRGELPRLLQLGGDLRQPAQRLLHIFLRPRAAAAGGDRPLLDLFRGQVAPAEGQGDGEGRALAGRAPGFDVAAVEPDQLVHQSEPDAAALETAPLRAFDPVEPLEQLGQLLRRDADAGVAHLHHRRAAVGRGLHSQADLAVEGELEGVGDQVEEDLLPHLPVHVDRLRQRRAVEPQGQARLLHRRTEAGRDLGAELGQVGGLVAGADPPRLQPREVQQAVHQTQEAGAVAMGELHLPAHLP